ncbi:IS21 family transposase [Myxococcota bacterium]
MSNVLSKEKRQQVLTLGRLGWPLRRIEETTCVRRETASKYLKAAGIGVRPPGRWGHGPPKPAKEVITDPAVPDPKAAKEMITDSELAPPGRSPQASSCEPHREFIELALDKGRNAMAIWQDLVDQRGFEARYSAVQRFVRKLRSEMTPVEHPVITTLPGQEAQVDYGEGPMVLHPDTGKYRRTRLFVLTLGFSRKAVRLLVWKSSTRVWCQLHEKAFRRLGGVTKTVVLDNLREGVIKADVFDPTLNPLYADMLLHYGVVALPCRVRHPNRKGKVESSIGHTQRTPLKGLRFESLDEAQAHLDRWDANWADTRIHGTTKRQVATMFVEEKPYLKPLPVEPFRYFEFGQRTVHLDGNVEIQRSYYAAPPGSVGKQLLVQWDGRHVRLLDPKTGELLREYTPRPPGHFSRRPEDRPKRTPPTTEELLARAQRAGHNLGVLSKRIHLEEGENGVRRILGLLGLTKKYGAVDDACGAALEFDAPSYRFVRRYIERKGSAQVALKQVDPLIRQLTLYRDLINEIPGGETQ